MRGYNRDCAICRLMRGLAFGGLGMALGGGLPYALGANREVWLSSGIVTAAILVFGLNNKTKNNHDPDDS